MVAETLTVTKQNSDWIYGITNAMETVLKTNLISCSSFVDSSGFRSENIAEIIQGQCGVIYGVSLFQFDSNWVVLRKWRDNWESCKSLFDESDFCVHVVGLPLKYFSSCVGKRLVSLFKGCKKVEIREEEVSGKRFFRLRNQVNILEPFCRVILITSDNGKSCSRGLIQYEGLPNVCYVCGLCDHTMNVCDDVSKGELAASEQLPFGPWLNARPEIVVVR